MATAPNDAAFAATSLRSLAEANYGSVRLRNALAAAASSGSLPFETVGEYLASPAPIAILRRSVRHLGARTAHELDRLVRSCAAPVPCHEESSDPCAAELAGFSESLDCALADVSLREALAGVAPQSRLGRVLAGPLGDLPCAEAIDDLDGVKTKVVRHPGAGLGTAAELGRELRLFISRRVRQSGASPAVHDALLSERCGGVDGPSWRPERPPADEVAEVQAQFRELLGGADCASAFEHVVASVRLGRLVRTRGVGERPLADALIGREAMGWELARVPAIGRKTIGEFWDVCWRALAVALARAEIKVEQRALMARVLRIDAALLEARPDDLAGVGCIVASSDSGSEPVVVPSDLAGLLNFLLDRVRPQDAPVLRRRFGLDGGDGETLEEIGADLGVTRERIRQLEKRGLGDLRVLARRVNLRGAVDAEWGLAWEALADGDDLVTDQEFATFRRSVPAAILLALDILQLDLADWLSSVSRRLPHGWLSPERDPAPIEAIVGDMAGWSASPLPRALRELGLPGSRLDVEAALLIGRGQRVIHGYLVDGRIGTRRRRALVAHALLARAGGPMTLVDLQRAYHAAAPADRCSTRDLTIVMSDASHLFLEVSEGRWAGIGAGGEIPAGGRPREADVVDETPPEQDLTVAAAIRDELERVGPQPLAALTDNPRRYLPRDRSHNSVQPTLIMRPDLFARLLPGVYCLWSQIPAREDVLSGPVPYLLDAQQARMFAMARRAREPWGTFPLWSPEAEYRLCRWALREASGEVARSLLATASVELWPVEDDRKAEWRARVRDDGRYDLLATVRPGVFSVRPELDRVLAALVDLRSTGRTSWMTLNRVDGRHVASQLGCSLLATLTLCGAVHPVDEAAESGWQLEHVAAYARVDELKAALEAELHSSGRLNWTSDVGRLVASRIGEGAAVAPAWMPARRFSELFGNDALAPAVETVPDEERVGEVGRALLAERRMADLLDWLDGQ